MYNPRDTWRQSHRKPRHSEAETKPIAAREWQIDTDELHAYYDHIIHQVMGQLNPQAQLYQNIFFTSHSTGHLIAVCSLQDVDK